MIRRATNIQHFYPYIFSSTRKVTDFTFISDASYNFDGRVIGITGGYGDFGTAITERVIKYGGNVIAIGRDDAKLKSFKSTFGTSVDYIKADLISENGQNDIIDGLKSFNADSLINNAGIFKEGDLCSDAINRSNVDVSLQTNLIAPLFITNEICKYWINNNIAGTIVNISSLASLSPIRGHLMYSIGKAGLDVLTSQIALELTSKNIKVNSLNPTVVDSAMGTTVKGYWHDDYRKKWLMDRVPIDRFLNLQEIVSMACYLLSRECPLVGECIKMDGGLFKGSSNIQSQMILPKDYDQLQEDYDELKQDNEKQKDRVKRLTQKIIDTNK